MPYLILTETSVARSNATLLVMLQAEFFNIATNLTHLLRVVGVSIMDYIFSLIAFSWRLNNLFRERRSGMILGFLCFSTPF